LLENLRKEYTAVNNQLESFISTGMIDKGLEQTFRKELEHKQELIDRLTLQIEELAKSIILRKD
jgi:transposase